MDFFPSDNEDHLDADDSGFGDEEAIRRRTLYRRTLRLLGRLSDLYAEASDPEETPPSSESEEEENQQPAAQPVGIMAIPGNPRGGDLATILKYNGEEGQAALNYIMTVTRAQEMFNWTNAITAQAAAARLEGDAANWLRAEVSMGTDIGVWENVPAVVVDPVAPARVGLKQLIRDIFAQTYTTANAVEAVSGLKQKHDETASVFYDRVRLSMDRKNFGVTEVIKATQAYKDSFVLDVKTWFLAGLRDELRQRVLGVPNPPAELVDILRVVRSAEAEISAKKIPVLRVRDDADQSDEEETVAAIGARRRRGGARGRGADRGRGDRPITCFGCGAPGHIARNCPSNASNPGRGGGRGGAPRGGQFQRGGGHFRTFRGPDRAYPMVPQGVRAIDQGYDPQADGQHQHQPPALMQEGQEYDYPPQQEEGNEQGGAYAQ